MRWLTDFAMPRRPQINCVTKTIIGVLLAAGLAGEMGSIVSELKKERRDLPSLTLSHDKIVEEIGDFLWYFVRLTTVLAEDWLVRLRESDLPTTGPVLPCALELAGAVGEIVALSSDRFGDLSMSISNRSSSRLEPLAECQQVARREAPRCRHGQCPED